MHYYIGFITLLQLSMLLICNYANGNCPGSCAVDAES
jgi:hypothetical protein